MIKKIGIITMHYVQNYGSLLQTYALQKVIESLGHSVQIIHYIFPNEFQFARGTRKKMSFRVRLSQFLALKRYPRLLKVRRKKLTRFLKKEIYLTRPFSSRDVLRKNPPQFDIYLTGSDQVWNPRFTKGDDSYLLAFAPSTAKKIAYASSFSCMKLEEEYKTIYGKNLLTYDKISVRENQSAVIVKELIGKEVPVVADPTFLLSKEDWATVATQATEQFKKIMGPYIFFYYLAYAYAPKDYITKLLVWLQKQTGYKVLSYTDITGLGVDFELVSDMGVEDFVYVLQYAECVVTNSFHGVAFSANFGAKLYAVIDDACDDRSRSLLSILGLTESIFCVGEEFRMVKNVAEKSSVDEFREKSLRILREMIES